MNLDRILVPTALSPASTKVTDDALALAAATEVARSASSPVLVTR